MVYHLIIFLASRICGLVASIPFEQFHKHSTDVIQAAAFGKDAEGRVRQELLFKANNLVCVLLLFCAVDYNLIVYSLPVFPAIL